MAWYPNSLIAIKGNFSFGALSSCKQATSGADSSSHRSSTGRRPFTPFTLYVAIFMVERLKLIKKEKVD
jgi:hypothetical protein